MRAQLMVWALAAAAFAGCGGGGSGVGPSYQVRVVVTGLTNVTGLTLQNNATDNLALNASGTYTFAGEFQGNNYNVTIIDQPPARNCIVLNGTGAVTNAVVIVNVVCPWEVGYAPSPKGVLAYYIDQSTGATIALPGSPFPAGANPVAIAVDTGFLYAANQADNTVSAYAINSATGALTAITGSPFAVGTAPSAIAINSQGSFAYVANAGSNSICAFSVNSSTGALTPVANSPFAIAHHPGLSVSYLAVSSGGFVYAGYAGSSTVSSVDAYIAAFAVNPNTGELSAVAGSPFPITPPGGYQSTGAFAIWPQGGFLYVGYVGTFGVPAGGVAVESIDPTTGALTNFYYHGFVESLAITSLVVDPARGWVYGGNSDDAVIFQFSGNPSEGFFTATYDVGAQLAVVSIDPSNQYLYAPGVAPGAYPYTPGGASAAPNTGSPYSIDPTSGVPTAFPTGTDLTSDNAAPVAFFSIP